MKHKGIRKTRWYPMKQKSLEWKERSNETKESPMKLKGLRWN